MQPNKYLLTALLLCMGVLSGSDAFTQTTIYFDLKHGTIPCPTIAADAISPGAFETEIPQAIALPNPFTEMVQVRATGSMEAIYIHDISGKVLQRIDAQGLSELNVDAGSLSNGIYFFIIYFENGAKTSHKLCKTY